MTRTRRNIVTEQLVFREARNKAELIDLLRLRCAAYRESCFRSLEQWSPRGFNLDAWDPYSRHYGLFLKSSSGEEPIGYNRMVGARTSPSLRILDLARTESTAASAAGPPQPLPMMFYWPQLGRLKQAVASRARSGLGVVEGSRLSIHPDYRSSRTVMALLRSHMANSLWVRNEAVWILCSEVHAKLYERLGLRDIEGTTSQRLAPADGTLMRCMEGRRDLLRATDNDLLAAMAEQMRVTGQIRQQVKLMLRAA